MCYLVYLAMHTCINTFQSPIIHNAWYEKYLGYWSTSNPHSMSMTVSVPVLCMHILLILWIPSKLWVWHSGLTSLILML